jgi:hypothetical protein
MIDLENDRHQAMDQHETAERAETANTESSGEGSKRSVMDVLGTSHRPDGPWPQNDHPLIAAWFKMEGLEMLGKKHESGVSQIDDHVRLECLTVVAPYNKGAVHLDVDGLQLVDLSDASGACACVRVRAWYVFIGRTKKGQLH